VGLIGLESTLDATAVNRIQDQLMGLSGLRGDVIRRDIGISTRSLEQQTASALNKLKNRSVQKRTPSYRKGKVLRCN